MFSIRSPLDLYKLCHSALLNGAASLISLLPDDIQCKFPVMPDIEISVNGVAKLLSNLNSAKAAGPDAIRPIVLKELSHVIAPIVTAIFQKSLDTGKVPSDWKKAQVCPHFKKGNKQDPANYRPTFLTSILCKTIEHIIASSLKKHFNQNSILYDLQNGFRDRRSCETQLLQLIDDLVRNMTEGKQIDLILLDFSKAFDKVNHLKLLYKLQVHGVQGKTHLLGLNPSWKVEVRLLSSMGNARMHYLSCQEFPRDQFWVRSCFCCILTTCQKMFNHRFVYSQMTLQFI